MEERNDKIIQLMTFQTIMEAEIIKSKLESFEIPCSISGQDAMYFNPLFESDSERVKLSIFERDYELAIKVLSDKGNVNADYLNKEGLSCPKCGSLNIDHYKREKKRFNLITFILSVFMVVLPRDTEVVYQCKDCGLEFSINE
jgi:DNA-directed RNA polymerase subunit RPC12/RpoP